MMGNKYVGKLKSFEENRKTLKQSNNKWDIDFITFLKDNEMKDVTLKKFVYDYAYENGEWVFTENLFSEIRFIDNYCSINTLGNVIKIENETLDGTVERLKQTYNYWKSESEAEKVEMSMRLYRAMRWWSYNFDDGYEFVFKETNWYIYLFNKEEFRVCHLDSSKELNTVYFSSKEKAERCLEWLKKEGLL